MPALFVYVTVGSTCTGLERRKLQHEQETDPNPDADDASPTSNPPAAAAARSKTCSIQ